jgi:hypothetical protein
MLAYGLAQEGIEAMRNIRDSNWLLGADFDGTLGRNDAKIWGESLPITGEQYFIVDFNYMDSVYQDTQSSETITAERLSTYAPWLLNSVSDDKLDGDETLLKKFAERSSKDFRFGHVAKFGEVAEETAFHRYLKIAPVPLEGKELYKYMITSVVLWKEFGRERKVELATELTDWNQGNI